MMNVTSAAAVVTSLLMAAISLAESPDSLVILAKPTRVKFVMAEGDLPANQGSSRVYVGGVYRTTLKVKAVLHGTLSQEAVTIDLIATSRENLSSIAEIVVVLSEDRDGKLVALGWDEPRSLACIPASTDGNSNLSTSFPIELPSSNERCVRL